MCTSESGQDLGHSASKSQMQYFSVYKAKKLKVGYTETIKEIRTVDRVNPKEKKKIKKNACEIT